MKFAINNLNVKIKDNEIISNVSLEFDTDHIYGIVGRNGSGKVKNYIDLFLLIFVTLLLVM